MTQIIKSNPIVVDVETQLTFQEAGNDLKKLKVSLAGVYDFKSDKFCAFRENELDKLFRMMEHASQVIGFNIKKFDLAVLAPYYRGNIRQFETVDLLELVEKNLGYRVSLDSLAGSTLGLIKSGHGLMAINYFRQGDWQKLESYCLDDVRITRDLYSYVLTNKKVIIRTGSVLKDLPMEIIIKPKKDKSVSLSLPF